MPKGQVEHANLSVTDPERSAKLFAELCGWQERWRGASQMGGWTIHVGALHRPRPPAAAGPAALPALR